MDNQSLLTRINSVAETLDPTIFSELVSTIQEQIKSERQKQEIKEIIDEVVIALIRITYELEDEKIEGDFYKLLEDLVVSGFDIGKVLIKEIKCVSNSEQQTKVITMMEIILKASSWIRKVSLTQKFDPVVQELISQNMPIRIREMLRHLHEQMKPYLKTKERPSSRPISLTLHADKAFIIQEWLKDPEVIKSQDPVTIQGISMLEFLSREVNFEILLDYILFSHEHGPRVLAAIPQIYPYFKKFKKFNPEKKISECVLSALSSNTAEFTALQSISLIKSLMQSQYSNIIGYFINVSTVLVLLRNLQYPEVRSFFFVYMISNKAFSKEMKMAIKNTIFPELYKRFAGILIECDTKDCLPVLEVLSILIPEILSTENVPKADNFEAGDPLKLRFYRKTIVTAEGHTLMNSLFNCAFKVFWCSTNEKYVQEGQIIIADLINLLIKSSDFYKPLKNILTKLIDDNFLNSIQANILHYSLNNDISSFKLPCMLITRPVGTHMIQLARVFTNAINFKTELVKKVSTNCWSTIFLWFFVFKSNGMLQNLISASFSLLFEHGEEKRLKEILIDKKFLPRIIETLLLKPDPEERDFTFFSKKLGRKLSEYVDSRKTKFTKEVQNSHGWKTLFPPIQESIAKSRPVTRSNKKGHTFILGLDPLEKAQPKAPVKNEHEIEHLATQLDLIYKVT
ncbi:hypothetical protein SteCoe_29168 [Stentor coeruleus]|uniref:Uncharacterized protein n=1 Tax=Stentor coeruleus TaxID=5963 RepID=A0A1R2B6X1_9CILI|nr:hypothetical protein SteCoe_29168 [Stentor coeruleus]